MIFSTVSFPDGKLLAAGTCYNDEYHADIVLTKYTKYGTTDSSFAINGVIKIDFGADEEARSLTLQPDGKLLVAGFARYLNSPNNIFLLRLLSNGEFDNTFGISGKVIINKEQFLGMKLLPDGKILFLGSSPNIVGTNIIPTYFLQRYLSNGFIDFSFGDSGTLLLPTEYGVAGPLAIQPDGKILLPGGVNNHYRITRLLPDGQTDNEFNGTGFNETYINDENGWRNYGNIILVQENNKIMMAGMVNQYHEWGGDNYHFGLGLVRYLSNGLLDSSFGVNGVIITAIEENNTISSISQQDDGKILIAGTSGTNLVPEGDFFLGRLQHNGLFDSTFGENGITKISTNGSCFSMAVADTCIYLSGWVTQPWCTVMAFKLEKMSSVISKKICEGAAMDVLLYSDISGSEYQWQYANGDSNYQNLNDDLYYEGVHDSILILKNIPVSFNGYQYRCFSDGKYSKVNMVEFENTWTGGFSNEWENAGNWSCNIVPGIYSNVKIISGRVNLNASTSVHKLTLTNGAQISISPGNQLILH